LISSFRAATKADIIVPTKAVTELQRLLTEEGDVRVQRRAAADRVRSQQHSARFEADRRKLSELQAGHSAEMKERVTLERETFLNSLRRCLAPRERQVEFDQAQLFQEQHRHHAQYAGGGRSQGIAARGLQRPRIFHRFNPEFLMAPLRNLSEDEIFLDLIDEMSPGWSRSRVRSSLRPDADATSAHNFA
jgi:DNA polymerase-3 subunit beta